MITLAVTYVIATGHETEAEGFLRELVAASRREPGCRTYDVHRAKDDPRAFLIYEQYDDDTALAAHRATPHFERYGKHGLQTVMASRNAVAYEPFA